MVAQRIIDHIDFLDGSIDEFTTAAGDRFGLFSTLIELMAEVPGVSRTVAEIVIAETGADMSVFPTPQQFAAWAGLAPANRESAGKRSPAGTRRDRTHFRSAT